MKYTLNFSIVIFALMFTSVSLFAQNLSLEDVISKAINTHPDIKRFILVVQSSKRGIDSAKADYLPQVNVNAEYNPTKTYVFPSNGVFNTKESDGWMSGVTLHQKIWDFSKTSANIDAQKESVEVAKLLLKDAQAYLAYKVKVQYELLIVQRIAIEVRKKDLQAKEELYKQAEAFVIQGMKTSADASRFLSSVYIAKDNLFIAKASFTKAKNILSLYINEKIEDDVNLVNSISHEVKISSEQVIIEHSPSLKALKKSIQKSSLEHKSAQSSHYGSLDVMASYSYQNSLNEYDSSIVGITLDIPLYSGGRISALVQRAEINKQSAQAEYNSKVLALKEEVSSLLVDVNRYTHTIASKKAQSEAANDTLSVLDARYKEGLSTYIEVLDASALKLDASLGLLSAEYERSNAIHKLEYLEGKIDE